MAAFRPDIPPDVAEVIRHLPPDVKQSVKHALRALSVSPESKVASMSVKKNAENQLLLPTPVNPEVLKK